MESSESGSVQTTRSMFFERVGDVVLVASGGQASSDEEWSRFLAMLDDAGGNILVIAGKRRPSPEQRGQLRDRLAGGRYLALVTGSTLSKGVGIALSWFTKRVRVFDPEALASAMEHVGLGAEHAAEVRSFIDDARGALPDLPDLPDLGLAQAEPA